MNYIFPHVKLPRLYNESPITIPRTGNNGRTTIISHHKTHKNFGSFQSSIHQSPSTIIQMSKMAIPCVQEQRCLYTSWHLPTVINHFISQLHAVQQNGNSTTQLTATLPYVQKR
jgi:hypothetical protein